MKILWIVVALFILCTIAGGSDNAAYAVAWIFLACGMSVVFGFTWLLSDIEAFGHFFRGMLTLGVIMAIIQLIFGWPLGDKHIGNDGSVSDLDSHGNLIHFVAKPHKPVFMGEDEYPFEFRREYNYTGNGKDDWDREITYNIHPEVLTQVWLKVNGELKRGNL